VRRLILDSLRYWVEEMHVDGFRFDLAAILSRDEDGTPMADPPVLWEIETDPVLAGTKLIAEAWDAGGLYQVGRFVGERWVEWNGRFRDDVRGFLRAEPGMVPALTQRFLGSPDIYGHKHPDAQASINFVTCHDGFTLADLVSYDRKHNEANGEGNGDGSDLDMSWNCGVEGPTDDPAIEEIRRRQIRNFLVLDLLSLGIPMLLMGDEVRRTQGGNNNAYCLDDPTSWFDWSALERHADILRFTKGLIRFRRRLASLLGVPDETNLLDLLANASLEWSGSTLGEPDLSVSSRSVALTIHAGSGALHLIFNAYWDPIEFELPALDATLDGWRRIVDTSQPAPDDMASTFMEARLISTPIYRAEGRSVVVLAARRARAGLRNAAGR
jgi:isoamylase